jgi:hypothetical protein
MTLFFGPEPTASDAATLHCVFNVKKRSWKGGIQVAVELTTEAVAHAERTLGFAAWIETALGSIAENERADYRQRAHDVLVQELCAVKLELAIEAGLPQENGRLAADYLATPWTETVPSRTDRLKSRILAELDLPGS